VAIGDALETTTGSLVPYGVAIALGTIVISAHVYSGGMKSVAWLDTFHMALGLVCTWGFLIYLVTKYFPGGLSEAAKYVKDAYPALLSHPGPKGTFTWKGVLNLALSGAIATFVWPHIFVRSYIAKSVDNFKTIAWAMPLGYVFSFGPLSVIGAIIGPALVPGLKDTDKLMPILASQYASTFMSFVLALAVFSFSVSTADSLLLAASTMASCDVYKRGIKGDTVEPKKLVLVGRLVIIILMVLTIVFAIKKPVYIVDYAYKLSSPGFGMILPAVVGGLYWKRGNATGAWAGTVVGLISLLLFMFVIKPPFGFSAFVWALLINTLFYIGGSLIGRPNSAETITRFFDNVNELKEKYK
jgi:SSS family solute:Na+ symporter